MLSNNTNPLLKWRKDHGYTQNNVADLTGLQEQSIRRVEHGTLSMPKELAQLMGGSAEYQYEQWRTSQREALVGTSPIVEAIGAVIHQHHVGPLAFKALRLYCAFDSVNQWGKLLRVDPRRITEVENGERKLGPEYRRALIQIGVPPQLLNDWDSND